MIRLPSLLVLTSTVLIMCLASYTDPACVKACSDWSIVLGHCRAVYGNEPWSHNETFANDFVNCCCEGEENDKTLGEELAMRSVGLCQSCVSTPPMVKEDLATLLGLCAVQAANGTAANAAFFKPQGYATSEDRTKAGTSLDPVKGQGFSDVRPMRGLAGMVVSGVLVAMVVA